MDYYKGIVPGKDEPKNGGSYVKDTKDAHEKYNFKPELLKLKGFPEGEYCLGFVETKSTSAGKRNQLNIEKIEGCSDLKNDTEVDDVLVVYCALYPDSFDKETYVVGWYKHATVYRRYEKLEFDTEASDNERSDNESAADEKYIQLYNAIALKESVNSIQPEDIISKAAIYWVTDQSCYRFYRETEIYDVDEAEKIIEMIKSIKP